MTNRLEINWKLDGVVDEQRYYCSETPIDFENVPLAVASLAGDVRSYVDLTARVVGHKYYVCISSLKNGVEKFSKQKEILFGEAWTPDDLAAQIYLNADDLTESSVTSWDDRKTGVTFNAPSTNSRPVLSTLNDQKAVYFDGSDDGLQTNNASITSILNNKNFGWIFVVIKKDGADINPTSRRIFTFENNTGAARLGFYSDDAVVGNVNKLVMGGRRLDADTYDKVASTQEVHNQTVIACGLMNYSNREMKIMINGTQAALKTATFAGGNTSATNSTLVTIGGVSGANSYKGWIAAIVAGNTALSDTDRQKLEGWAAHKYDLTDNLPIDHPYKTLVPTV